MNPKAQRLTMELVHSFPKENPLFDLIFEIADTVPQDWRRSFDLHLRAWFEGGLGGEAILQSCQRLAENYIQEEKEDARKR